MPPLTATRGLRTGALLAAIGLIVSMIACSATPRFGIGPDPGNPDITDGQRNRAMFSVHAHARWPDRDFNGAPIMAFEEAVRILLADTGPRADSRVRRAIAKLTAYTWRTRDYRMEAIELLLHRRPEGGAGLDITYDELLRRVEHAAGRRTPPIAFPAASADIPIVEGLISNVIAKLTPQCPYVVWEVRNIDAPPVSWTYELWVPRRMQDVARSLDPQHWDDASTLFHDAYLVDTPPSCCPKSDKSDCTYTKKPSSNDPEVGPTYGAAAPFPFTAFFESFCVGKECPTCEGDAFHCDVAFKNLLCARAEYDRWIPTQCLTGLADRYDVFYHHAAFLFGELNGREQNKQIDTDGGQLWVRRPQPGDPALSPLADWSLVHVDKTLSFVDEGNSIGVGKILQQTYADELAGQIAEQACFDLPVEHWISCPNP